MKPPGRLHPRGPGALCGCNSPHARVSIVSGILAGVVGFAGCSAFGPTKGDIYTVPETVQPSAPRVLPSTGAATATPGQSPGGADVAPATITPQSTQSTPNERPQPRVPLPHLSKKTTRQGLPYPVATSTPKAAAINHTISMVVERICKNYVCPDGSFKGASYYVARNDGVVLSLVFAGLAEPAPGGGLPKDFRVPMSVDVATGAQITLARAVVIDDKLVSAFISAYRAKMAKDYGALPDPTGYDFWQDRSEVVDQLTTADQPLEGALQSMQSCLTTDGVTISVILEQALGRVQTVTLKDSEITMRQP